MEGRNRGLSEKDLASVLGYVDALGNTNPGPLRRLVISKEVMPSYFDVSDDIREYSWGPEQIFKAFMAKKLKEELPKWDIKSVGQKVRRDIMTGKHTKYLESDEWKEVVTKAERMGVSFKDSRFATKTEYSSAVLFLR